VWLVRGRVGVSWKLPGERRGEEWKSGWSWRYKGELREGETTVVRG
jgi:hypothetical protein